MDTIWSTIKLNLNMTQQKRICRGGFRGEEEGQHWLVFASDISIALLILQQNHSNDKKYVFYVKIGLEEGGNFRRIIRRIYGLPHFGRTHSTPLQSLISLILRFPYSNA